MPSRPYWFYALWLMEETVITSLVAKSLPIELRQLSANELSLVLNEMKNIAFGGFSSSNNTLAVQAAADLYAQP